MRAIGGKAAGLAWLVRHSLPVPEAWVLPADAFAAALRELPPGCEPRSLLRAASGRTGYTRAAEARQEILAAGSRAGSRRSSPSSGREVAERAPWGLAVRSSATCEDGALVSMAGLAETNSACAEARALASAVARSGRRSLRGGRSAYLAAHGVRDVGMAVVIQRVVEAEAAASCSPRAPGTRARRDAAANRQRRHRARLAGRQRRHDAGHAPLRPARADHRVGHRAQGARDRHRPERATEIEVADPDEPALARATHRRARRDRLAPREARLVAWDVEFAFDGRALWVVQARPATGRGFPEGGDGETVWSSVNVGEAIPGVATPLTWSVAGAFSEAGFRRAFAALGCTCRSTRASSATSTGAST